MISANLQQWIQHPETLNKDTLYELRTLVTRYPYFQSLRLLYLKNLYLLHDISFGILYVIVIGTIGLDRMNDGRH
jgi:hypothetical protein